ncbi:MAG TPA: hypothetical protein DEG13_10130 [Candidatus Microthrix parvicella]|nr:hypothetical protein [Candidatus Microthrix parvicella]
MIHERETEFRCRKFAQIREAMVAAAPVSQADGAAAPHRQALVDALDEFRSTLDLEAFRQKLDANSRGAGFSELFYGFNFGVAMFLNSLVKKSGEPSDLAALLIETIAVPANDQQADEKLASLLRQVELVREGGHPAPKSAAIFCSFFWWFQAPETWPFLGPASEEAVEALGWLPKDLDPVDRYRRYRTLIRSLSSDIAVGRPLSEVMVPASTETITLANVDAALTWFRDNQWIGLDNALGDRLQWAHELYEQRVDGEYPDDSFEVARTNIAAVLAEMRTLGDHSETAVGNALGRDLRRHVANEYWMKNPPIIRANAWVKWKPKNVTGWNEVCSMIVSATSDGIAIGVTPGRRQSGWSVSIREELVALLPAGLQVVENYGDPFAVYAVEGAGQARRDFLVGTLIPMDQAVGSPDVAHEIERVAAALQPVFDRIMALAGSADEATAQSDATGEKPSDLGMTDEGAEPADEGAELEERLDSVVEECHLDGRSFIDDLVALLRDKRQIVLYGPPGTGKTYIARKLAEALAPSVDRRRFVQFHPSTSYEDFFEGYRPSTDSGGNLSYTLEKGPFASLVEHATEDGERRHLLTIDELNRANVPKVFGELLFLLEYRNESVVPLYRPDGFSVPENVWVIATMNTADRSIAMLDAALRRRFHFVPVFPDTEPISGVLGRYLKREGGEVAWASLLEMVNTDLRDRMGNGDQLIGPSHFMRSDLDEAHMKRIWEYNVEPLIDDLFYGDSDAIRSFKWAQVLNRFQKSPAGGAEAAATV